MTARKSTCRVWCLRTPRGLEPLTVADTREECWGNSFGLVAHDLGKEWEEKYWKRIGPSMTSARHKGYRIVRVIVREEKT